MKMALTPEGLALTTNPVLGRVGDKDAVTVYINRDGQGGCRLGKADLRLTLWPDGWLDAAKGTDGGFRRTQSDDIRYHATSRPSFEDDSRLMQTPWWNGELLVPLSVLAPFTPGGTLRMAVRFRGSVEPDTALGRTRPTIIEASWPQSFDPDVPETWALVRNVLGTSSRPLPELLPTASSDLRPGPARSEAREDGHQAAPPF